MSKLAGQYPFSHRSSPDPSLRLPDPLGATETSGDVMREFFRGWRRKTGCIALAMASLLAGAWNRSEFYHEGITFPIGKNQTDSFYSLHGNLNWMRIHDRNSGVVRSLTWVSSPVSQERSFILSLPDLKWRWQFCGFGIRELVSPTLSIQVLVIPYWSVVPALTALSACLLLWPTNRLKKPPVPE